MQDVAVPFLITMFYAGADKPDDVREVDVGTPRYRDFTFSNIIARGARIAGTIAGLREMPAENITFANVRVQAAQGFTCTDARGVTFNDVVIDAAAGPVLRLRRAVDVDTSRLKAPAGRTGAPLVVTEGKSP